MRLAVSDFSTGGRAQAYRELEAILKQQPKNESALETKARFLLADGKKQEALALTKALVDANEKSATGQYLHGVALEANGSIDEAIAAFQNVLQLIPSAVDAQVQLANLYLQQGYAKGALDLAQQALKAQPQSAGIHFLYAQALLKSNDLPNAERELLALAKAAANFGDVQADVQTWLGMLYETRGDLKRARDSYQKAFDLAPKATAPLGGLVGIDLDEKKPAAALARGLFASLRSTSPQADGRAVGPAASSAGNRSRRGGAGIDPAPGRSQQPRRSGGSAAGNAG